MISAKLANQLTVFARCELWEPYWEDSKSNIEDFVLGGILEVANRGKSETEFSFIDFANFFSKEYKKKYNKTFGSSRFFVNKYLCESLVRELEENGYNASAHIETYSYTPNEYKLIIDWSNPND